MKESAWRRDAEQTGTGKHLDETFPNATERYIPTAHGADFSHARSRCWNEPKMAGAVPP